MFKLAKNMDEELEKTEEEFKQKAKQRDKRKEENVSGKSVFKIKEIIERKAENTEEENSRT